MLVTYSCQKIFQVVRHILYVTLYCATYLVIVCVLDVAWFHYFPWSSHIWVNLGLWFELNTMASSTIAVGLILLVTKSGQNLHSLGECCLGGHLYHVPLLESIDLRYLRGSNSRYLISGSDLCYFLVSDFPLVLFFLLYLLAITLFFSVSFVIQRKCTLLVRYDWLIVCVMVSCIDGMVWTVSHDMI